MADKFGYTIINMAQIADKIKATLGSEEEPFEGEISTADIEKEICSMIE